MKYLFAYIELTLSLLPAGKALCLARLPSSGQVGGDEADCADEGAQGDVDRHPRDARGGGEIGVSRASNTRGSCKQYSRALLTQPVDFANKT